MKYSALVNFLTSLVVVALAIVPLVAGSAYAQTQSSAAVS
jgi:hypothetical protein